MCVTEEEIPGKPVLKYEEVWDVDAPSLASCTKYDTAELELFEALKSGMSIFFWQPD